MSTLTVTAKGQVTLRKDLLKHLGVNPGEKITVDKLPDGRIEVRAARPAGKISDAFGFLKRKDGPSLSIEKMKRRRPGLGPQTMRITADTNVLVRAVTEDHAHQSKAAQTALKAAELIAIPIPSLCELVWVLSQGYKVPPRDIAEAIRRLMNGANVAVNRPAAEAGLALLEAGGDFADGVIAFEGNWLGADTFVSFDKRAVKLMEAQGGSAGLLA